MWADRRFPRLQPAATAVHRVALRQIHLPLIRKLFRTGLGFVDALPFGDGRRQPAAAAARRIPVPRPLPIDVGELSNPPLVALADAQRACRLRAKLKAPSRVVAEAHHVRHVRRLRRRREVQGGHTALIGPNGLSCATAKAAAHKNNVAMTIQLRAEAMKDEPPECA